MSRAIIDEIRECFDAAVADGIRPDPILTVSEWADAHRILSPEASAEAGLWRTTRTPYLRDIMDALSPKSPVEEVVLIKSAQIGGTEAGINWVAFVIDMAPGPTMVVQPTVELAKRWSKGRLDPAIDMVPRLRSKMPPPRKKDPDNTTLTKKFQGGFMVVSGANSAVGLRSIPIKNLFMDEVDGYPDDVDSEGDPVELATARTRTFARRKIFKCSTPTIAGRSRIEAAYLRTGQRRYHVPCPHCGTMDSLKWLNLKWEHGKPETAQYVCPHCSGRIQEHSKTAMMAAGRWIPDAPELENGRTAGFHINSLYSPLGWYGWAEAARDWELASKDTRRLRVFINTVLGETFKEKGEAPEWRRLYDRRENYVVNVVPEGACLLTAGCDVQRDRLELEIVAWGPRKESWSIDYRVIPGDTSTKGPWERLSEMLAELWPTESGSTLGIRHMAVDSGYNTQFVYDWVKRSGSGRAIATKGVANQHMIIGQPRTAEVSAKGKRTGYGIKAWPIGTDMAKGELYGWLRQDLPTDGSEAPMGYCHFPQYEPEFFEMLTAEEMRKHLVKGHTRYSWEKIRDRNEALDCRILARAAASLAGIDRFKPADWKRLLDAVGTKSRGNGMVSTKPGTPGRTGNAAKPAGPKAASSFWRAGDKKRSYWS